MRPPRTLHRHSQRGTRNRTTPKARTRKHPKHTSRLDNLTPTNNSPYGREQPENLEQSINEQISARQTKATKPTPLKSTVTPPKPRRQYPQRQSTHGFTLRLNRIRDPHPVTNPLQPRNEQQRQPEEEETRGHQTVQPATVGRHQSNPTAKNSPDPARTAKPHPPIRHDNPELQHAAIQ